MTHIGWNAVMGSQAMLFQVPRTRAGNGSGSNPSSDGPERSIPMLLVALDVAEMAGDRAQAELLIAMIYDAMDRLDDHGPAEILRMPNTRLGGT